MIDEEATEEDVNEKKDRLAKLPEDYESDKELITTKKDTANDLIMDCMASLDGADDPKKALDLANAKLKK